MIRRGGSARRGDGRSRSRYSRGGVFGTVFSVLASILASTVGGLTEGSRASHARPMAYGSGRPRTEATVWPIIASLEAAVARRTVDVVDDAAFFAVDRARDTLNVSITAGLQTSTYLSGRAPSTYSR